MLAEQQLHSCLHLHRMRSGTVLGVRQPRLGRTQNTITTLIKMEKIDLKHTLHFGAHLHTYSRALVKHEPLQHAESEQTLVDGAQKLVHIY